MHLVTVKDACSCFLRSALPESQQFADKATAKGKAQWLLVRMNREFCKKHTFSLVESFDDFTIYVRPR